MEFGERFHALRLKKGLSEDQIASFLGVSWKEITSWEKGRAEPSLPMLMKISAYFGVSTDSLLGMDRILRETLIADYLERYHTHISENRLPEAIAVMREGLLHFPDNHRLKCMLLYALYLSCTRPAAIKHYSPEILSLGEEILSSCTDDAIRLEVRRVLCLHWFDDLKDPAKATEIAKGLPARQNCREELLAHVSTGEEKCRYIKQNLLSYGELLSEGILQLLAEDGGIPKEARDAAILAGITVLDTLFPGEGEGEAALPILTLYKEFGLLALRERFTDEGFTILEKAAKLAVCYDTLPEKSSYSSPLVGGLTFQKENPGDGAASAMLASLQILGGMDALRYDKRLAEILAILTGENKTEEAPPTQDGEN